MNAGGVPNTCKSSGGNSLRGGVPSGGRVSNTWVTCPPEGDNQGKPWLIPHTLHQRKLVEERGVCPAGGGARGPSGSWWGNGPPSRRRVAGLRGWSATGALRHGPHSYGRQQWGILDNGGNPDPATPRAGRSPSGCKPLWRGKNKVGRECPTDDGTPLESPG
ncbi:MAG: hypothetical protein JG779_344 [Thermotoga sp.]|nr:hypothetical protein [Thermotoga sp.]MDK2898421.1 hypothetical protein [Thermotoga sp.]